jgi:hypothetical protein
MIRNHPIKTTRLASSNGRNGATGAGRARSDERPLWIRLRSLKVEPETERAAKRLHNHELRNRRRYSKGGAVEAEVERQLWPTLFGRPAFQDTATSPPMSWPGRSTSTWPSTARYPSTPFVPGGPAAQVGQPRSNPLILFWRFCAGGPA